MKCGLCSHNPACGFASITIGDNITDLCHTDNHSCYEWWTVHGKRPTKIAGSERIEELEVALLAVWEQLDVLAVNVLREQSPDVVALCQRLHRAYGY